MAISSYENLISNLSYTEKDFQTIYPALLDLVKKETSKWDPSASNESDPGVLLLKLNAIIADKCNYNIDKNILECFPVSVTQIQNARQLYEQLGYYMHWYKSAETIVTLKYIGNELTDKESGKKIDASYTIPMFTMVCDSTGSYVYTLVEEKNLKTSGIATTFKALQGIAVNYKINDRTLIKTSDLDSNNRLYFETTQVAENGIFITNSSYRNYTSWVKKDNLLLEEVSDSNYFYKFGVSQDLGTCYLEFPSNADELFGEGINITYLATSGEKGNISTKVLDSIYNGLAVINPLDQTATIALTTDQINICNYYVGANGKDPESIDEAYLGYKKVVGTFDTLITLRDYLNAVKRSEFASNAVVSDRTNDIQTTYKIMSKNGTINQPVVEVTDEPINCIKGYYNSNNDKFYYNYNEGAFSNEIQPELDTDYFDILDSKYYKAIKLGGEFKYIESDPTTKKAMDAFDLKLYILSTNPLMTSETNYDNTFELNTNESIQAIVEAELNDYKCIQHNMAQLLSNRICFIKDKYTIECKVIPQYAVTTAQRDEILSNIKIALFEQLNAGQIDFGQEITYEQVYEIIMEADPRIKSLALYPLEYTPYVVYLEQPEDTDLPAEIKELDITNYIANALGNIDTNNLVNRFRIEIYAKSVLAGKTQFFIKDDRFGYNLNQKYLKLSNLNFDELPIGKLVTNLNVEMSSNMDWQYTLKENESIQLSAPNLIEYNKYLENVKIEYHFKDNKKVVANESYLLSDNEYIVFYWADSEDNYSFAIYGDNTIIKPSFDMNYSTSTINQLIAADNDEGRHKSIIDLIKPVTVNNYTYDYASNYIQLEDLPGNLEEKIRALTQESNQLSASRTISILLPNKITIDSTQYYCYWVLNEKTDNKYILFKEGPTAEDTYTLKTNEYFIYTDATQAEMIILGSGTTIERKAPADSPLVRNTVSCNAIDYSEIIDRGLDALVDNWVTINEVNIDVTEMQYLAFGEGCVVSIEPLDTSSGALHFSSIEPLLITDSMKIKYKPTKIATEWTDVPLIKLDTEEFNWRANAYLRIDSATDKIQTLRTGQSIEYWIYNKETGRSEYRGTLSPASGSTTDLIYFYLSRTINDIGPSINTLEKDEFGIRQPIYLYAYNRATSSDTGILFLTDNSIMIKFDLNETEKRLKFKLPQGEYVLPIMHSASASTLEDLSFSVNSSKLASMYDDNLTNFKSVGLQYIKLNIDSSISDEDEFLINLTRSERGANTVINLILYPVYKYSKDQALERIVDQSVIPAKTLWDVIYAKIKELDVHHKFDYTYVVPEDINISNPLDARSYLNYNHVFNNYTICQMDTTPINLGFQIMNVIKEV